MVTVILNGFLRVSTEEQGDSGHSLADQETQLRAYAELHGHTINRIFKDVESSRNIAKLKDRDAAMADIEAGNAEGLICKHLDRLSRGVLDGATQMERAKRKGWYILTVDGTDTRDEETKFLTDIKIAFAEEERRKISKRTKAGLNAARAKGVRLGRPRSVTPELAARITAEHAGGKSYSAIARDLTAEGVPTPAGAARWYPATARDVVLRESELPGRELSAA